LSFATKEIKIARNAKICHVPNLKTIITSRGIKARKKKIVLPF
jgi:hypothetical protein